MSKVVMHKKDLILYNN